MRFLCLHLSDIHFNINENSILEKEEQLFDVIKNSTKEFRQIFLIVSGDVSFSGKTLEFAIAKKFIETLKRKIEEYSQKTVSIILIPGNHDCNFFEKSNLARQNQINAIQKLGDSIIDDSVIDLCTIVQEEYFEFEKSVSNLNLMHSDKLLKIYEYAFDDKIVLFNCYNTSYLSELREQPGKMYFPISLLPSSIFERKADLVISLFHHPFNWLSPINKREFYTHIHKTSDFYFTGHEHELSKSMIDDLDGNVVYHIEGSVLQDSEDKFQSEFNLVGFDLNAGSFKNKTIFWNGRQYQLNPEKIEWQEYKRGKSKLKSKYTLEPAFKKRLDDIGGKFTHPNSPKDITLTDLFVYPKLRFFNTVDGSSDTISYLYEDGESVISNLGKRTRILIFGEENIGKTSLLKQAYQQVYKKNLVPVFVEGHKIKNSDIEEFKSLVKESFRQQYGNDSLMDFEQEDLSNVYIIIDDYDKTPLRNQKAKGKFVKNIINYYENIILSGSELIALEEILSDEKTDGDLFSSFKQYEILDFNPSKRAVLIQKWYSLGITDASHNDELWQKCDNAARAINITMNNKVVPNYPIFLLILLQALETTNPHDLRISSYGSYYQLLILKSLTENIKDQADLLMYQNYSAELAHFFFKRKTKIISEHEFISFHKDIISFEKLDLPLVTAEKTLITLCKVGILEKNDDNIEFKYLYTYYYFEGQYLARNINKAEIKRTISEIANHLYISENANILMFLIQFSNDDFIIEELINNAKKLFEDLQPCKLENDIDNLQKLAIELPKLYLKNKSVEEIRKEENEILDEIEEEKKYGEADEENVEGDTEIDVIGKINLSFKLIELLGQILKNNHGVMSGTLKHDMLKEIYLVGLRSLNKFFTLLNDNTDFILNQLKQVISNAKKFDEDKLEKISRNILFSLCSQVSLVFVKKISDSVGTNKLIDKYPKIEEEHSIATVMLINFLIKLDHQAGFPDRELGKIKGHLEDHPLPYYVLKRIVINHLHRHFVDYKDKQRICSYLGIPMERQLKIEASLDKK